MRLRSISVPSHVRIDPQAAQQADSARAVGNGLPLSRYVHRAGMPLCHSILVRRLFQTAYGTARDTAEWLLKPCPLVHRLQRGLYKVWGKTKNLRD